MRWVVGEIVELIVREEVLQLAASWSVASQLPSAIGGGPAKQAVRTKK